MKKSIAVITGSVIVIVSGLAFAQMPDQGKERMDDKSEMMEGKGGMMGKGMMGGKMMGMMGMMHQMRNQTSVAATSDGGALVVSGGKLIKYDNQLNIVKQVDLPKPEMGMMGQGMGKMDMDGGENKGSAANQPAEDHSAHH